MKNDYLKFLIPLAAVVVILESVVLLGSINNKASGVKQSAKPLVTQTQKETPINLVLAAKEPMVKLGESKTVELRMQSPTTKRVDAINLYVKYDVANMVISNLKFNDKLPKPTFSKISDKGLVVVNFLVPARDGFEITANENISLITFDVKPKKVGNYQLQLSTGKESKESATMIVENKTSKVLPYSDNVLTIQSVK